ncbi:hypothetical protein A9299_07645 [Moraxella osloensis]|uniref:Uncharacterized protein n=1 Tax=Faucicola osloensis TaxID=34062 RepID=A0AA91JAA7_FAUOS|nr:hypothetical protein [Moraxella osloensis]OBX65813.1 hypothetical protein A9299_07645 [Moraxella osloensis]
MRNHLNLFDVMTALQFCRIWLEFYRNEALARAEEIGVYNAFFSENVAELDSEISITACNVFDTEVLEEDGSSILEILNHSLSLKRTLTSYLERIETAKTEDYEKRAKAIKTGIYFLDQQIYSIQMQMKTDKKIFVCLEVTPSFETQLSEAIHLLDQEALQIMQLGLGINFTPPHKI